MSRDSAISLSLAVAAVLTGFLFIVDAGGPVRALVATLFLLIGPGLAFVRLFPVDDAMTELVLAVAASLGLETVVATALLVSGFWSPGRMLAIAILFTLACLFIAFRNESTSPEGDAFQQAAAPALSGIDRKGVSQ